MITRALLALAACVALAGCGSDAQRAPSTSPPTTSPSSSSSPAAVTSSSAATGLPRLPDGPTGPNHPEASAAATSSPPVRVRIPSIGVSSSLQALAVDKHGVLQPPNAWGVAGWYAAGVRPGDTGPAVIAGHVDSVNGPAVFFRLRQLKIGAHVFVDRADGSTVRFVVAVRNEYPKRTFPTEAVYGPSSLPTLRLITCAGDFDRAKRSYVDNLVLTAYLG